MLGATAGPLLALGKFSAHCLKLANATQQALHEDDAQPSSAHISSHMHTRTPHGLRKTHIGSEILQHALKSFCNHAVPEGTRRWGSNHHFVR